MQPTIGRIVHYRLTEKDATEINRRRIHANDHLPDHIKNSNGVQIHWGPRHDIAQVLPMIVTNVLKHDGEALINGQVLLDGNDSLFVKLIRSGVGNGEWEWPVN